MKLGKREAVEDPKTLGIAEVFEDIYVPPKHDFDKRRAAFPLDAWGNNLYGNCVKVGQANQTIRFQRIESRRTLPISSGDVIDEYKKESKRQFGHAPQAPGDQYDDGLIMLESLRNWRKVGWNLNSYPTRSYKIAAFGSLNPKDGKQLRQAIYLLHGIQVGLWLPKTAQAQYRSGQPWSYVGYTPDNIAGSWGGHLVYAKAYDENNIEVITWGKKQIVTNEFFTIYCDECYATVDSFDEWKTKVGIDVEKMISYLRSIGVSGIE